MITQVLTLNQPTQSTKIENPFLQELIRQVRYSDIGNEYSSWSNEFLLNQLLSSSSEKTSKSNSHQQILTTAFYQAIGATIKRQTGHPTKTFIHLKDKKLRSAVISCGGVIVLSALIWEHLSFDSFSLANLIELAEYNIAQAINKASQYLDFVA